MDITEPVSAVIADLRRVAVPGALGDASDRAHGVLADAGAQTGADRFVPSAVPLAVAIDGPGLFELEEGARRIYSRLGDFSFDERGRLMDGAGRAVVGFRFGKNGQEVNASAISVEAKDMAARRFASFSINERGVVNGVVRRVDARTGRRDDVEVPIARVAIGIFPAPENLGRMRGTGLQATRTSGMPVLATPGEDGASTLRTHVLASGAVDIQGDLRRLWMLRRKAELAAAVAGALDSCTRAALGLVR